MIDAKDFEKVFISGICLVLLAGILIGAAVMYLIYRYF